MTKDRQRSGLVPAREAITGSWSPSVDFISSIVAGLLIGLLLDWWLGTRPWLTVLFIVGGFVSGFYKLWRESEVLEQQAEERRRG
jgi:ATP synthase protein I